MTIVLAKPKSGFFIEPRHSRRKAPETRRQRDLLCLATCQSISSAQVLTYLKLSGFPIALLMNFNVTLLKTGVKRRINPHPAERFLDRAVDAIDKPKEDLR